MASRSLQIQMVTPVIPPDPSGEACYVDRISEALVERGHQVSWITQPEWGWRALPSLVRRIRKQRPDWVWIHFTDWMFGHPMIRFLPLFLRRERVLFLFHNPLPPSAFQRVNRVLGASFERWRHGGLKTADCVVALSESHKADLKTLFATSPIYSVPNFSFLPPAEDLDYEPSQQGFHLAFFGYVYPGKDLSLLFRAMQALPATRLTIFGGVPNERSGTQAALDTEISALGLTGRVTVLGSHDHRDIEVVRSMQQCDLIVLPYEQGVSTRRSSFAGALSLGVPVLTSQGEETEAEYLESEQVAFYEAGSLTSLVAKLRELAEDPGQLKRLARGGTALYWNRFHLDRAVDRFEGLMVRSNSPVGSQFSDQAVLAVFLGGLLAGAAHFLT